MGRSIGPRADSEHHRPGLRWCLHGQVHWNDGPNLDAPATDASGEKDFGNIDVWLRLDSGKHLLEGDWGNLVIDQPSQTVEYLD